MSETQAPTEKKKVVLIVAVIAVVFAIVYVLGALAFGKTDGRVAVTGAPIDHPNSVSVTAIPIGIDPATEQVTVRMLFKPTGSWADENGNPSSNIVVHVNSYSGARSLKFPKGEPIAAQEIRLFAAGNWSEYPFDNYTGDLEMTAFNGSSSTLTPVPIELSGESGFAGWSLAVNYPDHTTHPNIASVGFELQRPFVSQGFALLALAMFVLIGIYAASVAIAVGSRRRRIEPALLGWGAALIFALPALRGAMPGVPPVGAWIDILVFLWAMLVAIVSYLIVVSTWVRSSPPPA